MKIKPIEYEGSIEYFRAWMDRYIAVNGNERTVLGITGQKVYVIYYEAHGHTSTREIWIVQSRNIIENGERKFEIRRGMILATETSPNKTNVDFLDGQYFGFRDIPLMIRGTERQNLLMNEKPLMMPSAPIRDDFVQFVEDIKTDFEREHNKEFIEPRSQDGTERISKIKPMEYIGSVSNFRAWMDRFLALNGKIFKVKKDTHILEYHIGYFTPARTTTREVWNVYIDPEIVINGKRPGGSRFAMILAVEDQPNRTIVEFIDGQCYERTAYQFRSSTSEPRLGDAYSASHEPIGDDFVKISQWITEGLNEILKSNNIPDEPKSNNLKEWFDYLHAVKHRTRIKLEYIATKTGYAHSTVKKEHSLYLKEKGIPKVTKSNQK